MSCESSAQPSVRSTDGAGTTTSAGHGLLTTNRLGMALHRPCTSSISLADAEAEPLPLDCEAFLRAGNLLVFFDCRCCASGFSNSLNYKWTTRKMLQANASFCKPRLFASEAASSGAAIRLSAAACSARP